MNFATPTTDKRQSVIAIAGHQSEKANKKVTMHARSSALNTSRRQPEDLQLSSD